MEKVNPNLEASWLKELSPEFDKDYFAMLKRFLVEEKRQFQVFPPGSQIFSAFDTTPFDKVKVVLLGQDPYHGPGQAHGLCFSVPDGVRMPPSLVNIFQEIKNDLGIEAPKTGNLTSWAKQGVLLLNATLTVRANQAGSHQNKGWEQFTDEVIRILSARKQNLVFMLWGNYAQAKENLIDTSRHLVLKAAHPSPFSVYRGFYGCGHFSKANSWLEQKGIGTINWQIQ